MEVVIKIEVKDNNVEQALRDLKMLKYYGQVLENPIITYKQNNWDVILLLYHHQLLRKLKILENHLINLQKKQSKHF